MKRTKAGADIRLATAIYEDLRKNTSDGIGITRASYGEGEQYAGNLFAKIARDLSLEVNFDFAGNVYCALPGRDRSLPKVILGSHIDSVPAGGNYDGITGAIAGLSILSAFRKSGFKPQCDLVAMGIRAEETPWFPYSFIGSRAALGILDSDVVDRVKRNDSGKTVAEHMSALGYDPDAVREKKKWLTPANTKEFIEVHIEQGPRLVEEGIPTAIVSGINGSTRWRQARVLGEYGHSGGVPRRYRHDAVAGFVAVAHAVERKWKEFDGDGKELVATFCTVNTDSVQASMNRISGEVSFCVDIRSLDQAILDVMTATFREAVASAELEYRVKFEVGPHTFTKPSLCDPEIRRALLSSAKHLGIPHIEMPSGGGHDAQAFMEAGIPAAMIFVRNENGSHNPAEHMEMADFDQATQIVTDYLVNKYA